MAEPKIAEKKICNCNCENCEVCGQKDTRDILLASITSMIENLSELTKSILGFVFSIASTLINIIILYVSFPGIKSWGKFQLINLVGFVLEFIPVEAFMSIGFIMCSLSSYMHQYVEIGLTLMLSISSFYWSFSNGQWLALVASVFMFLYALLRTGLFSFLPNYILGLFKYTSLVVFGLLASNLAFNISNNFSLNKKLYNEM